jgi:hypothetical protein
MVQWCVACAVALVCLAVPAAGQDRPPGAQDMKAELQKLRERLDALEQRHQEDVRLIRELESRLDQLEAQANAEPAGPEGGPLPGAAREPAAGAGLFDLSAASATADNAYNPQITVFIDTGVSVSNEGRNKALNRFNLREVELDLRAAISPQADGVLILAIPEEIESQRGGGVEISHSLELEEGYLDFHTMPHDTAMRIGKFRASFGRNNLLHTHDLPQVTRPAALQAFFGPEGLSSTGASLSRLVPNPWDQYIELMAEVVNADGGEEAPILGGPNADNPAVVAHLRFFRDVGPTGTIELGGSYLYAHTSERGDFDANVFGLDAAYTWTDPDPGKFRSFLLQGEVYYARNDVDRGWWDSERNGSLGAYAFAQYQLDREWYVGLRGDYTQFPNSETRGSNDWDAAGSPYVTWYLTEFLRVRLEYQHRLRKILGNRDREDALFLQLTGVFGSHPPHPYWVRR